jgi:hypothetical protein
LASAELDQDIAVEAHPVGRCCRALDALDELDGLWAQIAVQRLVEQALLSPEVIAVR